MNCAIMQPYFFPYLGYFQLMNAVDVFVVYDDVHFMKKSFINRNSILVNGEAHRITLSVNKQSQNRLICEHTQSGDKSKLIELLKHTYRKAPYYKEVAPVLFDLITCSTPNLARYLGKQLAAMCDYLDLKCKFVYSSSIDKPNLRGQDKIINICTQLNASRYINPAGGKELYDDNKFSRNNIDLLFVKPKISEYQQFHNSFVSHLSIIDVMMFNSVSQIQDMVNNCELEKNG